MSLFLRHGGDSRTQHTDSNSLGFGGRGRQGRQDSQQDLRLSWPKFNNKAASSPFLWASVPHGGPCLVQQGEMGVCSPDKEVHT